MSDYIECIGLFGFKGMSIDALKEVSINQLRKEHIRASDKLIEIYLAMPKATQGEKQDMSRLKKVIEGYIKSIEIEVAVRTSK